MVPMRDGTRLNTFVILPANGGPRFPVILHRTPYGIAAGDARDKFDCTRAWLPNPVEPMRGSILRGWRAIVAHGYAAVYQDCRGRHGSEGEDRVYADDAADGYDTLDWIAAQNWTNGRVGISGSSAGATTTFAADAARNPPPPFVDSPDWMRLPLAGTPDFATWQPFLDEIISHPAPDEFRGRHDFRRTIDIPGFHVTSWFDIFQTSVIAAFQDIQARTGTQKLWVGPNEHYFVYAENFWPRDPYFEWFGHWLKDEPSDLIDEPAVFYSPRAWVANRAGYRPDDWRHAERWPPPGVTPRRLYLRGDGSLEDSPDGEPRHY